MSEDIRLKRLKIRSWRRGIKEMDLILGTFCDRRLAGLSDDRITLYEAMLAENDQDLYQWVSGQAAPPEAITPMIQRVGREAGAD